MNTQQIKIEGIPAILWGPDADKLFIAVHGDGSNKMDADITILAQEVVTKGYQLLSFDLPENGERKDEARQLNPQNAIEDLSKIIKYAHSVADDISLYGCSLGAYFSMLAFRDEEIEQALFLSPVVDMKRIINNMMTWFDVSEKRLEREKEIPTPAKTLYWGYYQYVCSHPVRWDKHTAILYGAQDGLCEADYVKSFAKRTQADLTVMANGEHHFHTEQQLAFYRDWLKKKLSAFYTEHR